MMSYANLIQNQAMIFQQQHMLEAQYQTNAILAGNEQARQKEKQVDIWMEEFKFQGMSPLESHKQALGEWEINEIKAQYEDYRKELSHLLSNALQIVKDQISNKPIRKALLGNWSGKFITISEESEEVLMYKSMAEQQFKDKVVQLNYRLLTLPKSKIESDSDFRETLLNVTENLGPLELLEAIAESLDLVIYEFKSKEREWDELIAKTDYANRKTSYSKETEDLYNRIRICCDNLRAQLPEFSDHLLKTIRSDDFERIFETSVAQPIQEVISLMNQFQIQIN